MECRDVLFGAYEVSFYYPPHSIDCFLMGELFIGMYLQSIYLPSRRKRYYQVEAMAL